MAKRFLDAAVEDERGAIADQDGTALTLTNTVRVLYDNTKTKTEIIVTLDRIKERIIEVLD